MTAPFGRISAEEAYRASLSSRASKWPDRASGRIEPVCLPAIRPGFVVPAGATVFTMGSCFARNIEIALRDQGYSVPTLAFRVPPEELWAGTGLQAGILNKYTPFSMLNEVEWIAGPAEDDGSRFLIETADGRWWDGQLHTTEAVDRERALKRRARLRRTYADAIGGAALMIVTLGLVEAWWDEEAGLYLNDTAPRHLVERHPGRFRFETLSPASVIDAVERLVVALHRLNPAARLLMTVSPVPFVRSFSGGDAIVANGYSKAVLRVAAECAVRAWDHVDYFPSYESVTLSERGHAWEDDLVHVRPELIAANVERMMRAYTEQPAP